MTAARPYRINTISEFHQLRGLPKPEHPLISVVRFEDIRHVDEQGPWQLVMGLYSIALKRNFSGKLMYGQQEYDFDEGIMLFISPGQVFSVRTAGDLQHSGWLLLIHPDFLWKSALATKIQQYEYFDYTVHEALHLSEKEESMIVGLMRGIQQEYQSNIDKFSQEVIIAQLELLLTYSERFYQRQFITRKISNHRMLDRLEELLDAYFSADDMMEKGLPSVQYISERLNMSPGYLGSMLKMLTGQSTQQHIHDKVIALAKEKLSTTDLSVGEIAYQLGFEHSQSFSKLFKAKTRQSPLGFRRSFN